MSKGQYNIFNTDEEGNIISKGIIDYCVSSSGMRVGKLPICTVDGNVFPDTITEIPVTSVIQGCLRENDTFYVVNRNTLEVVETFVCSADVNDSDTTIEVNSITITKSLNDGMFIVPEKEYSNEFMLGTNLNYRYTKMLIGESTSISPVELTTNGTIGSTDNRILVPLDRNIACDLTITGYDENFVGFYFKRRVLAKNDGGSTTIQTSATEGTDIVASPTHTGIAVSITADDLDDAILVEFTGKLGYIFQVKCAIEVNG